MFRGGGGGEKRHGKTLLSFLNEREKCAEGGVPLSHHSKVDFSEILKKVGYSW